MTARTYDVIIVGAGIVGGACANQCVQEGLRCAVIDRDGIGSGATAAAMGHIVVMDDSQAQFALTRYSQQLWHELSPELPAGVEYEQRGTIWVAADSQEMEELRRKQNRYLRRKVPVEVLDEDRLQRLEPNLRKGLPGGLLVPEDAVLDPPAAARFLLQRALAAGVEVLLGRTVVRMGKGSVRVDDGDELSAAAIVNATGVWASGLTPGLSIRARKGHLAVTDRHPGFLHHQLVELGYLKSAHASEVDSVAFNVQPRKNGQILIGSSRQYDVADKQVDAAILSRMRRRAQEYMPDLAGLSTIRAWTGLRAATPDKLPLIGPLLEDPTVFLAAGHEGLGITTSLASARLVFDQVLNRESAIPIESYLPSRMVKEQVHI
jgi:D-hydroxyproline dehydrogenase subunit beta